MNVFEMDADHRYYLKKMFDDNGLPGNMVEISTMVQIYIDELDFSQKFMDAVLETMDLSENTKTIDLDELQDAVNYYILVNT